jgi:hypothetical protein
MNINIIEVESNIHLLAMNFSNTFFQSVGNNYAVVFNNSNVVDEWETLDLLYLKLLNRKQTVIIKKDIALLSSTLESYTLLIGAYKALNNISIISPKLKRYDMVKYLQDKCKEASTNSTKDFITPEFKDTMTSFIKHLTPTATVYKSKKEEMEAKANAHFAKLLI